MASWVVGQFEIVNKRYSYFLRERLITYKRIEIGTAKTSAQIINVTRMLNIT